MHLTLVANDQNAQKIIGVITLPLPKGLLTPELYRHHYLGGQ